MYTDMGVWCCLVNSVSLRFFLAQGLEMPTPAGISLERLDMQRLEII